MLKVESYSTCGVGVNPKLSLMPTKHCKSNTNLAFYVLTSNNLKLKIYCNLNIPPNLTYDRQFERINIIKTNSFEN